MTTSSRIVDYPDGYLPIKLVAEGIDRPVQTIYTWIREGAVRTRRDRSGRILVCWRDVLDTAATRRRHGTRNRLAVIR